MMHWELCKGLMFSHLVLCDFEVQMDLPIQVRSGVVYINKKKTTRH